MGLWCLMPLSTIFQLLFVAVSFIGGGNRSTRIGTDFTGSKSNYHMITTTMDPRHMNLFFILEKKYRYMIYNTRRQTEDVKSKQ